MTTQFHVIKVNNGRFEPFDVVPFFVNKYNDLPKTRKPATLADFRYWVEKTSKYFFWCRTEYEIILKDWPCQKESEKWDIHRQLMMNFDLLVDVLLHKLKLNYAK